MEIITLIPWQINIKLLNNNKFILNAGTLLVVNFNVEFYRFVQFYLYYTKKMKLLALFDKIWHH
jgi:hypothetical protein